MRAKQLISIQNQIWRSTGNKVASNQIRKRDFQIPLDGLLHQSAQSNLTLFHAIDHEITQLERTVVSEISLDKSFEILKTIKGIGDILGRPLCWKQVI